MDAIVAVGAMAQRSELRSPCLAMSARKKFQRSGSSGVTPQASNCSSPRAARVSSKAGCRPLSWASYQRSEDYYSEGELIWLDVDTLIREQTGGKKSLDDFAKAFFGVEDGSYVPLTYEFADVVKTLNAVSPHDWTAFLKARVEGLSDHYIVCGYGRMGTGVAADLTRRG